jgi:L-iditol 2-dehydrogenase
MLAALLYGKNDLRIEDVKTPEAGPGEVLLQVKKAAICGTDVRMLKNGYTGVGPDSPRILGHEMSGVIAEIGANVEGYKKGMRVTVAPNMGCGICNACVRGDSHLCPIYRALGVNINGGFAEYVVVPELAVSHGNIIEIPEHISFEEAALNEPLSCAYNGFERSCTRPGDRVLIIGAGPIGLMHAMLAKMGGASKVYINDLSAGRLEVCRGVDKSFITVPSDGLKDFIDKDTGGEGVDVCITANPAPAAQELALELACVNGRVIFFGGLPAERQPVSLNSNLIHYKQLIVSGTTRASLSQYRKTLGFISSGIIDLKRLVTEEFPLREIDRAFEYASNVKGLKNIIAM